MRRLLILALCALPALAQARASNGQVERDDAVFEDGSRKAYAR